MFCKECEAQEIKNHSSNTTDPADEIAKYKKLLDDNAITQEQFNAKRDELLKN